MNADSQVTVPAGPAGDVIRVEKIDKAVFRDAMCKLSAAVNIITTDGPAGKAGFTASAVCSVTDDPPTLRVCLNQSASVSRTVTENGVVCVNVLATGHQTLSSLFGGKTPVEERFGAATWETLATGAPVLRTAAVAFDCEISDFTCVGTHDVLFCRITAIRKDPSAGALVYFARKYHELADCVA